AQAALFTTGGAILGICRAWSFPAAAMSILWTFFQGMMLALRRREDEILPSVLFLFGRLAFGSFALFYYVIPIPGLGVAFPDVFTTLGRELAGAIQLTSLNEVLGQI